MTDDRAPTDRPESDRVPGAPHPRETARLIGHDGAERDVLESWAAGRLHHAWLLRGPRGVGKATLAYRIARARLAAEEGDALFGPTAPDTLDVAPDHPVARRIAAEAEPRLLTLTRELATKPGSTALVTPYRLRAEITVDAVRRLGRFLHLSAADGGWRAVIVDAADEMNRSAANALLKLLEEPPERVILLLVAHAPGRLPPTIRSRCRALDLAPLGPADLTEAVTAAGGEAEAGMALAALSGGSPGEALRLAAVDGAALYARLVDLLADAPTLDRAKLMALVAEAEGRDAAERAATLSRLTALLLQRLARAGATGPAGRSAGPEAAPGEAALAARLAPDLAAARRWAERAADIQRIDAEAAALNLDRAAAILDMWLRIEATAGRAA
jgi:DNA polymerase-3 subunit delta'